MKCLPILMLAVAGMCLTTGTSVASSITATLTPNANVAPAGAVNVDLAGTYVMTAPDVFDHIETQYYLLDGNGNFVPNGGLLINARPAPGVFAGSRNMLKGRTYLVVVTLFAAGPPIARVATATAIINT